MGRVTRCVGMLVVAMVVSSVGPVAAAAQTGTVGFVSHPHFGRGDDVGGPPTCCKAESKLWFHDGTWWATMIHRESSTHRIHRLAGEVWVDTGVVVDSHLARADVLHIGDTIWVTGRNTSKLVRFSYVRGDSPGAGVWTLDAGFPVDLPVGATPGLTIVRDSTGTLWIAWLDGGAVKTARSSDGGVSWSAPATLPFAEAADAGADEYAAITAFRDADGPAIGVMWSNQPESAKYFAVHRDGTSAAAWSIETALAGSNEADDHISFATFEDRVFATVKTSHYEPGQDLIKLLTRTPQGVWTQAPVAKVGADDTRPIGVINIDPAVRRIFVFTRSRDPDGSSRIVSRSSWLNGLGFPSEGTTILKADRDINDVTSMKTNATAASGLVVMAQTSDDYWWNRVDLPTAPRPEFCASLALGSFPDVDPTSTHGPAVGCAAGLGLLSGYADGRFRPTTVMSRAQAASVLDRTLAEAGLSLPAGPPVFGDVSGTHADAIHRLAAAGVITGTSATTFEPDDDVTRAQLVSLLDRAATRLGTPLPDASTPPFGDVGDTHAETVARAAAAGITSGYPDGTFRPWDGVRRDHAASLLTRWLDWRTDATS